MMMIPLRSRRRLTAIVGPTAFALSGCGDLGGVCTGELRSSLVVEVRDAATGEPAARGVTGVSEHATGVLTELTAFDELRLLGDWERELAGRHTIVLRKPGFVAEHLDIIVGSDECHVETRTVQGEIRVDAGAVSVDPLSFSERLGADVWPPASAGVQVHEDTLEIAGFAPTDCTELRAVAFRHGIGLHVQIEPSDEPLAPCASQRQFEVRYLLPPDATHLLVTNGFAFPVDLFDGVVRPQEDDG